MNVLGWDFQLPNLPFVPGYIPGTDRRGVPDPARHREILDRINERLREVSATYGVSVSTILNLPAGIDFEDTTFRELLNQARLNTERLSEFEQLINRTQFERLLDRPYIPPVRDMLPSAKETRPGGTGDYRPALPPKKLPGTTPTPSLPPPGGSGGGAGGGGFGSTLGGLLQLPIVRRVARVAGTASPLLDAYDIWRTYLDEPSDWVKQRDREAARRGRGPSTRGGARTRTSARTDAAVLESERRIREERTHAQARRAAQPPTRGTIWDTPPVLEQPDYTRAPGPTVATRRDTSRQPTPIKEPRIEGPGRITVRNPTRDPIEVQQPWWRTLGNVLYDIAEGYLRSTPRSTPRGRRREPRSNFSDDVGRLRELIPESSPRGEAQPRSSPATQTEPSPARCSSSDPCMRRAADKRREQRRRAKECKSKVKVTREVTLCQQSK